MNLVSVKHKITLGLVFLMASTMVLIYFSGLGPNPRAAVMHGRAQLCETVAIQASMLTENRDQKRLTGLLENLVERNDEILSCGLLESTGTELVDIASHFEAAEDAGSGSTETFVRVPLRRGGQMWAELQIKFRPIAASGVMGWILSPLAIYVLLVGVCCFFSFSYFLGRVLQQLDPSNAVPKRVRTALDTLTEGLIVTDIKGRVILANETFSKWAGQDAEKLVGKKSTSFAWKPSADTMLDDVATDTTANSNAMVFPWQRALDNERPEAGHLMAIEDADGNHLTLVANSSPVLGGEGVYRGVLTSFEDVTDLERHKVELSLAKKEADRANHAKSEFLARMSHEIRTPMNAILGYTEVLQFGMEDDPDKREQHLATIQSSGEHLLALINDILDLSKIESGQMELELSEVSVHELISHVVSVLKIKAEEKGIFLEYSPNGPMPVSVRTDGVRLKQAIINLVGNAIKFTEKGGVMIQPRLVNVEGKTMLDIIIADTGIGMTAESMGKIFAPFAQADTSITRRFGGTGLGLSICKELSEQLGGSVSVSSEVGKGSVFCFQIDPGNLSGVDIVSAGQLVEVSSAESESDKQQFSMPDANILIVDDGESNRELVALFLKRAGMTFEMAVNGKDAVDRVQAGNFHAVLMDMHMPVMDGFTATQTLRALGFEMPIVALTADAMAQDERVCREAGCSHFLPKPINRDLLYKTLREALPGLQVVYREKSVRPEKESVPEPIALFPNEPTGQQNLEAAQTEPPSFIESSLPMDDEDFVNIANMFASQLNLKIEAMIAAVNGCDFEELHNLGHWLKGAGGSAGFEDFSQPGHQLEFAASREDATLAASVVKAIQCLSDRIRIVSHA